MITFWFVFNFCYGILAFVLIGYYLIKQSKKDAKYYEAWKKDLERRKEKSKRQGN